jgi:hypothetical protein
MSLVQELRFEFKAGDLYNALRLAEAAETEFFHISSDHVEVFKSPSKDMTRYMKNGIPKRATWCSLVGVLSEPLTPCRRLRRAGLRGRT